MNDAVLSTKSDLEKHHNFFPKKSEVVKLELPSSVYRKSSKKPCHWSVLCADLGHKRCYVPPPVDPKFFETIFLKG